MRAAIALALIAACAGPVRQDDGAAALATRRVASLDVFADGDVVHALLATELPGRERRWAMFYVPLSATGEAQAAPVRVDVRMPSAHRPRHGSDPQIAARGRDLVAMWTTRGTGFNERGPLQVARSRDGGRTWTPGGAPSPIPDRRGQAFVDLAVDEGGEFHAVWLDDRGDPKGLYHASTADVGASWRRGSIIDGQTCQCCWNRLVPGRESLFVLYRDSAPRDMTVSALAGDRWQSLGRPARFDWAFEGCPHVGGGLAVAGDTLHATVWTGDAARTGLFHARWVRGAWQPPHLLAAEGQHSDVAAHGDDVVAAWDMTDPADQTRAVFRSQSRDGGRTWSPPARLSGPARAGHPRALHVDGRFRVLWIEEDGADQRIRAATL